MKGEEADEINQRIARSVTDGGYAHVFTTELDGKKVIRMCTINPETTEEDIANTIRLLRHEAGELSRRSA